MAAQDVEQEQEGNSEVEVTEELDCSYTGLHIVG